MIFEGQIYMILEKMDANLNKLINAAKRLDYTITKPMPMIFIKKLTYSIIEGLDFLRTDIKVIHRDIKPSNILIGRGDLSIKIGDFGIVAAEEKLELMGGFNGIGSNAYMSPERLQWENLRSAEQFSRQGSGSMVDIDSHLDSVFLQSSSSTSSFNSRQSSIQHNTCNNKNRHNCNSETKKECPHVENCHNHKNCVDHRCDIWSVGLTLAETIMGEYPYGNHIKQSNRMQLTKRICNGPPNVKDWR